MGEFGHQEVVVVVGRQRELVWKSSTGRESYRKLLLLLLWTVVVLEKICKQQFLLWVWIRGGMTYYQFLAYARL